MDKLQYKHSTRANKAVLTINKFEEHLILGVYGIGLLKLNPRTGETSTFKLKEKGPSSKRIFTTYIDTNELWVGGFDGPLKHFKNNVLINTYKTGNARSYCCRRRSYTICGFF